MDLEPLLAPRSIAVVGATDRPGSYADQTLRNLAAIGFEGPVWGVHPTRREVHERPCVPTVADLPEPVDAVVVAIPAAGVPAVVEQAGARGCGGAVVYAAGFGEVAEGAALEAQLRVAALRHDFPVCGPNCDGIVAFPSRAALWGDALRPREGGHVALVAQSGNVAVNALGSARGLRLHTVVSCGNQAVVGAVDWLDALAGREGVRSVALFLEADGDGRRLCEALAHCAEAGVGVAVLKVGASAAGASAAAAHTGAVAGDHAAFRALVEEAGAAWCEDVHDLLEVAKALAVAGARPRGDGGTAILTCSGGDSGLGADEAERRGLELPPLAAATRERLRALLPAAATLANPLDYTALIWGEADILRDTIVAVGDDEAVDHVLVFYDQPPGLEGAIGEEWDAVRVGIRAGAAASARAHAGGLHPPRAARRRGRLRAGRCRRARRRGPAHGRWPARRRCAGRPGTRPAAQHRGGRRARRAGCLAGRGEREGAAGRRRGDRSRGRLVSDEEDAAACAAELGGPVALKLVAPELRHKTEAGALALDLADEPAVRAAYRRLAESNGHAGARVLVEAMAPPGLELLVSARRDAVVPVLTVGLGGVWTEALGDAVVVPLPADPARVERALRSLRAAPLLTGGRAGAPLDVSAAAALAARAGDLLLEHGLELLELNPVLVGARGAVAVDALARAGAHSPDQEGPQAAMNEIAAKLGEVGLPAPVSELAAREWDAIVVGGGHNGLTAAAYLARAGSSVLVLERRERLGGACTLERPFPDERFVVSPCAYVVGLLDELVIRELDLRRRGFECYVADPNLWVPFEDGTSFGQWLDDNRTQANLEELGVSRADIDGYWRYEHLFDSIRRKLRTGPRDTWVGDTPTRAEIEELLDGEQEMLDIVFEASIAEVLDDHVSDQRIKDALFGQGVIAAYGGPKDPGTASIKLMHYQGDLEGGGPVWGYVRGGMGMISFALADAAAEAGAVLACGVPVAAIVPEHGVVLEDGTRIRAPDRRVQRRPQGGPAPPGVSGRAGRLPRAPGGVEGPQPGGEVQRRPERPARVDRGARRDLARPGHDRPHRRPRGRPARVRGLRAGRAGRGLRGGLHPDGL